MKEVGSYSLDIPEYLQGEEDRTRAGHTAAIKLVEDISEDNPSENFVGLPAYQFIRIAKYMGVSLTELADSVPISTDEFISLARGFDEDVVSHHSEDLGKHDDEYKELVDVVSKKIANSDLGIESSLGNLVEDVREGVVNKLEGDINKLKKMDEDRRVMVGIIAMTIVRSDLDVENSLVDLSESVRDAVLEELGKYESGENKFGGIKTSEMFDLPGKR